MKISTILDQIDSGHIALPAFQRGYVWTRDQVRNLFDSLYRGYPIGGLLVWVTDVAPADRQGDWPIAESAEASYEGDGRVAERDAAYQENASAEESGSESSTDGYQDDAAVAGSDTESAEAYAQGTEYEPDQYRDDQAILLNPSPGDQLRSSSPVPAGPENAVRLLLDGQQRISSVYGVVRGRPPAFFDGNAKAFAGLRFHLEHETFSFSQSLETEDAPLWLDVTEFMQKGSMGIGDVMTRLSELPAYSDQLAAVITRLSRLLAITDADLHIEEVTGPDKSIPVVVDLVNRVNSAGTTLSKGDLALARICVNWPDARETVSGKLEEWTRAGYRFDADWLLRSVDAALGGDGTFQCFIDKKPGELLDGFERAVEHIHTVLDLAAGRLGLDHDRVFVGRFGVPLLVRYLELRQQNGLADMDDSERDKLLFWFVHAGVWGRYSGSVGTHVAEDMAVLQEPIGGLDRLLEQLRLWHGELRVEPVHFGGWSVGARFYPVLYMLARMGEACDWDTGALLKPRENGGVSPLTVHHIFPMEQLRKRNYPRAEVDAIANFCFSEKDTGLVIADRWPEAYFPEVEARHPGVLASQWIPQDPALWTVENFREFLEQRKKLLAHETNRRLGELLHGDDRWMKAPAGAAANLLVSLDDAIRGSEEEQLQALNDWMEGHGLCRGVRAYAFSDPDTGEQKAVFDLAWPDGVQRQLTEPVAVVPNDRSESLAVAGEAGFRCFTTVDAFRRYVRFEVLADPRA